MRTAELPKTPEVSGPPQIHRLVQFVARGSLSETAGPSGINRQIPFLRQKESRRRSMGSPAVEDVTPLQVEWQQPFRERDLDDVEFASVIRGCSYDRKPDVAEKLLFDMKSQGFKPGAATLSTLMLLYVENGCFGEAQKLWSEIIENSMVPSMEAVSSLLDSYVKTGHFKEILRILHDSCSRDFSFTPQIYSLALSCLGNAGELDMMEVVIKDMVSRGFKVDSITGNAFVKYYSLYGSIEEMKAAYERLKKSRILLEKGTIKTMALAYISQRKYFLLGEFVKDVGLGRRNTGNLLWNLLLLSFAANFKMKSLQREFLAMVDAGFSPDITTFNIRALAFTRMRLFWDLHLSVDHMKHEGIVPDLVTYGCVVDAYLDRRLGKNLPFVLDKMNKESFPVILTDPLVFEAFGKGDFHSTSEALLEARRQRKWTYSKLVAVYLRKQYRANQIFWNY